MNLFLKKSIVIYTLLLCGALSSCMSTNPFIDESRYEKFPMDEGEITDIVEGDQVLGIEVGYHFNKASKFKTGTYHLTGIYQLYNKLEIEGRLVYNSFPQAEYSLKAAAQELSPITFRGIGTYPVFKWTSDMTAQMHIFPESKTNLPEEFKDKLFYAKHKFLVDHTIDVRAGVESLMSGSYSIKFRDEVKEEFNVNKSDEFQGTPGFAQIQYLASLGASYQFKAGAKFLGSTQGIQFKGHNLFQVKFNFDVLLALHEIQSDLRADFEDGGTIITQSKSDYAEYLSESPIGWRLGLDAKTPINSEYYLRFGFSLGRLPGPVGIDQSRFLGHFVGLTFGRAFF